MVYIYPISVSKLGIPYYDDSQGAKFIQILGAGAHVVQPTRLYMGCGGGFQQTSYLIHRK